jgi:hypothetical protein
LIHLRDEIDDNDRKALSDRLETALAGRIRWFDERLVADWVNKNAQDVDVPSFGERVNQTLFGGLISDRKPRK